MSTLDDLLATYSGGWSNPIVNSITVPTGAGPGTPRVVFGSPPACLTPITNGVPTAWNGRSAVACIQMYNTGTDFEFIAEILASSGTQRTYMVVGRAADSVTGANVAINQSNVYDTSLALAITSVYNQLQIIDGDTGNNGGAELIIARQSVAHALGSPIQINFVDSTGATHFSSMPVLGVRYLNGSGSSQLATGVITWMQLFGVGQPGNTLANYPVFAGNPLIIEGQFMFNSTVVGSGVVVQVHRMAGATPVPATDPVIATARGVAAAANANDTRAFRQVYFNQALSGGLETYYMSMFGFGAGNVTVVSQSDGSIFGLTWFSVRDIGSLST
jgi:hypothetical protein